MRLALGSALLLVVFVPASHAAGITVLAEDILPDIAPGSDGQDLVLHLDAQCSDILPLLPLAPKVLFATTGATSPYFALGGDLDPEVPFDDCEAAPTGRLTWDHTLRLSVKGDSPGLETLEGILVATIERPGVGNLTGESAFRGRVAYVGRLVVEGGTPEYNATTGRGIARIAVTNEGNARTTAAFQVDAPAGDLVGPSDVVLNTNSSGLATREVVAFEFLAPDGDWTTATFDITVRGHAFTASVFQVDPLVVQVTFTNNAQPKKDTPTAGADFLVPGLLGLAFAMRRRS